MANEIVYRTDIYNAVYAVLMNHLANEEVPSGVIHDVLKTINETPSTFSLPAFKVIIKTFYLSYTVKLFS